MKIFLNLLKAVWENKLLIIVAAALVAFVSSIEYGMLVALLIVAVMFAKESWWG